MPSENRLPFGFRWVKAAMNYGSPGPTDAIFRRHELDIASLVTKPGIRERVQLEDRLKVIWIGHPPRRAESAETGWG